MAESLQPDQQHRYHTQEVWFPLSEDILGWDYDFHRLMLNDQIRMKAYEAAIKEVVQEGMTVVDIGTGTGILAQWALEAGAKKVYGIDVNKDILTKATERLEKAGLAERYQTFNDLSYNVNLPERVDVVLSEILGNLGDNEDMTPILEDARQRFLKDGGVFIPQKVETYLVPVEATQAHEQVKNQEWKSISPKYDVQELLTKLDVQNQFDFYYDTIIPNDSYLAQPLLAQDFSFSGNDKSAYGKSLPFTINKAGLFTGFKGYFIAQLSPNVILDISGDDIEARTTSDCWKHCYLPIQEPIQVAEGDEIALNYTRGYPAEKSSPFRQCYSWQGIVTRRNETLGEYAHKMC